MQSISQEINETNMNKEYEAFKANVDLNHLHLEQKRRVYKEAKERLCDKDKSFLESIEALSFDITQPHEWIEVLFNVRQFPPVGKKQSILDLSDYDNLQEALHEFKILYEQACACAGKTPDYSQMLYFDHLPVIDKIIYLHRETMFCLR